MTDEEFEGPDDARIRSLLGEIGPAGPIPPTVSESITRALHDLPAPEEPATSGSRNGHRVGRWLVAAAAVVVVGGGGTVLVQNLHSTGSSNDSAAGGESARSSMSAGSS